MTTESLLAGAEISISPDITSPRFFGPEGGQLQETFIADQPLEVSRDDYETLVSMSQRVADFIRSYDLDSSAKKNRR